MLGILCLKRYVSLFLTNHDEAVEWARSLELEAMPAFASVLKRSESKVSSLDASGPSIKKKKARKYNSIY